MAYVARTRNPYDRLLKPGDEPQMAVAGAPAAAPGAPAAPNNPQASGASGFVSFGQRMAANAGAADAMAGKVAGGAEGGAQKAQGQLGQVQQGFQAAKARGSLAAPGAPAAPVQQVPVGAPPPGQAAAMAGMVRGSPTASPYSRLLQPASAPTMTAQPALPTTGRGLDPSSRTALRTAAAPAPELGSKMLTDREKAGVTYSGPEDLRGVEGYDALEAAALDSDDRLAATADNAGLEGLVSDAYAGQRTAGGNALDAALTGAAGGERFAQLRRQYAGLSQKVADANKVARGEADAAKASTADAAKAYGAKADAADADQKRRDDEAKAAQIASEARQADLERQAALPRQQQTAATADRRGVTDMTTTIGEERQAQMDGLWQEWLKAGSPPYEQWKASRKG